MDSFYKWSPQAFQIAEFLGENWGEHKVYDSLQRLGLIEEEKLDKEAIESLPIPPRNSLRNIQSALKRKNLLNTNRSPPVKATIKKFLEEHLEIVKKLRLTDAALPVGRVRMVIG